MNKTVQALQLVQIKIKEKTLQLAIIRKDREAGRPQSKTFIHEGLDHKKLL